MYFADNFFEDSDIPSDKQTLMNFMLQLKNQEPL